MAQPRPSRTGRATPGPRLGAPELTLRGWTLTGSAAGLIVGGVLLHVLALPALAAMLLGGMFIAGCETSHSETDRPTITGGEKHEETTTYKNPVTGDTSVDHRSNTSR